MIVRRKFILKLMRIGLDFRNVGKGRTGDETVFFQLVRALAKLPSTGHRFILFVDDRTSESLDALAERLGIAGRDDFAWANLHGGGKFRWNAWDLPRALRGEHPVDVYHTQYITPFFVPSGTRVVTHIHDVSFRRHPELIGLIDRLFLSLLIPRSLRAATHVVAVSEFTKQEIIECYGVPAEKISVVPNALGDDFISYMPADETLRGIREKYRLPEQFVLYVGTLQPRKNLPFLIRSVAELRKMIPTAALVLVGNRAGHHFDTAVDEAVRETGLDGQVIFPGFVDQADLPGVIRLATVFAFPSLYEGFGIPLLEAMSQDVPVVASDTPALREVGGDAAIYISPTDLAALRDALYNVFVSSEIRDGLVQNGRRRLADFSWEKSARKLLNVYESLKQ